MGVKRAMVVLENQSGLPRDRVVNTFHFSDNSSATDIHVALSNFYNPTTGGKVGGWIGEKILRDPTKNQVRVYDLADAEPREATVFPLTIPNATSTSNLPNELAVCLSFYADRNLKRQRGRIYLGPLVLGANVEEDVAPDQQVAVGLIADLKLAAQNLIADALTTWVVYSRMDQIGRPVTNGWIDNAFDVQRRRGKDPSSRTTF